MTLYLPGGTSYPAYPQVTYQPYPQATYQPYPQATYQPYPQATYQLYPQSTYSTHPQTYPIPYFEPSVYRVHYKVANLNGTQQQFDMDLQAYNENDAFQKALRYLPPFSQITKIRFQVTHPHL